MPSSPDPRSSARRWEIRVFFVISTVIGGSSLTLRRQRCTKQCPFSLKTVLLDARKMDKFEMLPTQQVVENAALRSIFVWGTYNNKQLAILPIPKARIVALSAGHEIASLKIDAAHRMSVWNVQYPTGLYIHHSKARAGRPAAPHYNAVVTCIVRTPADLLAEHRSKPSGSLAG